jgi:hypothetical protein
MSDQLRAPLGSPDLVDPIISPAGKTRTGSALETFMAGAVAGALLGTAAAFFVTCPTSTNRACLGNTVALSALVIGTISLLSRL